jgi:hypothetical protein
LLKKQGELGQLIPMIQEVVKEELDFSGDVNNPGAELEDLYHVPKHDAWQHSWGVARVGRDVQMKRHWFDVEGSNHLLLFNLEPQIHEHYFIQLLAKNLPETTVV